MISIRESVQIVNQRGLHARASAKFVNVVSESFESLDIKIAKDGVEANGSSILGLMMLGAAKGDTIEIIVSGDGSDEAMAELAGLVRNGFGED